MRVRRSSVSVRSSIHASSAQWLAALMLTVGLPLTAAAQLEALRPHSAYEPPMAAAAVTLQGSTDASPKDLLTTGERTNWQQTGVYDEVVALAHALEKRSPFVKTIQFGTTAGGRPMLALIVSGDRAFTPEAAHRTGKAVILIQSGIHSGEIEGKDTALMLIRDMVVAKRPHEAAWLNSAIFVVIPVFNVDGHESRSPFNRPNQNGPETAGTRQQAELINLNRDYVRAATPEMQSWLRLYQAWLPDFMFDNHVTDGADYQYDVTWDMAHHGDIGAPTAAWVNDRYIPELNKRMEAGGHLVSPYGALQRPGQGRGNRGGAQGGSAAAASAGGVASVAAGGATAVATDTPPASGNPPDARREFFVEVFSPRYSHLYSAAMNRPCLLVETHSLKEPRTRAWSHYDIMTASIDIVTENAAALTGAVKQSDAAYAAIAGDRKATPVFLAGKTGAGGHPLVYHSLKTEQYQSEITGATVTRYTAEKDDLATVIHDGVDTTAEAPEPLGFLIPVAWKEFADELALHGVQMERTTKPMEQEFDTWRFSDVKYAPAASEGGILVDYKLRPVHEKVSVPAGSYYVPMHQMRAHLIMTLLHPAAPDALIRWGFAAAVFQPMGRIGAAEYLTVPIANKLASERPDLLTEFRAKVAADPAFAADPQARVEWWVSRSSYQPSAFNRYPIVEVWEKNF